MKLGILFRLKADGPIYTTKAAIDGRCLGCVAEKDKALCHNLPMCFDANSQPSVIFSKLSLAEMAKAKKSKAAVCMADEIEG